MNDSYKVALFSDNEKTKPSQISYRGFALIHWRNKNDRFSVSFQLQRSKAKCKTVNAWCYCNIDARKRKTFLKKWKKSVENKWQETRNMVKTITTAASREIQYIKRTPKKKTTTMQQEIHIATLECRQKIESGGDTALHFQCFNGTLADH